MTGVQTCALPIFTVMELDNGTTVPGTSIGVQFIHAATAADPVLANALGAGQRLPVQPGVAESDGGLAASEYRFIGDGGAVALGQGTALSQLTGVTLGSELAPSPAAYQNAAFRPTALKLAQVQALSYPNPDGGASLIPDAGEYRNGAGFVFIAVGDLDPEVPTIVNGRFNTRKFHYLGFPTSPNIPRFE